MALPRRRNRPAKLSDLEKALAAAKIWHDLGSKLIAPEEAGNILRKVAHKNWSVVHAAQYLTGAKALAAFNRYPEQATYEGLSKKQLLTGFALAHSFCATASSSSKPMSGATLIEYFK